MTNKALEANNRFQGVELNFLKVLWKTLAPLRVQILVWQILVDRLPTKINLARRNIISIHEVACALCQEAGNRLIIFFSLTLRVMISG
jgi:hypothetical protein